MSQFLFRLFLSVLFSLPLLLPTPTELAGGVVFVVLEYSADGFKSRQHFPIEGGVLAVSCNEPHLFSIHSFSCVLLLVPLASQQMTLPQHLHLLPQFLILILILPSVTEAMLKCER